MSKKLTINYAAEISRAKPKEKEHMSMVIKYMLGIGLLLVAIWGVALLAGACTQLNRSIRNSIQGSNAPVGSNPVLTRVLSFLGLSSRDRLTCSISLINALMLWPITIFVAMPTIKAFRSQETRLAAQKHQAEQTVPLPDSAAPTIGTTVPRANTNQPVPS